MRFLLFKKKKERLLLSMKTYISKESRTHFELFSSHRERVEVNDELGENFISIRSPVATFIYLICKDC
jgi:hypothetical protein